MTGRVSPGRDGFMDIWGRVFAAGYDRIMAAAEEAGLAAHRDRLLANAAGRVLEIGGGTGANLPFFGAAVSELVIAEPEEPMARRLERKLRGYQIPTRVIRARAEDLPLETASFDCAVATLVLCTVPDPHAHCRKCTAC
jgi:ubiquinone/menaquinone biosynthesis C-methylase UbiE